MRKRPGRKILVAVAMGAVLVVANSRGWLSPLRVVTGIVLGPVEGLFGGLGHGIANFGHLVITAKGLSAENTRLEAEVAVLKQKLAEDAQLRQENTTLRAELQFGEAVSKQLRPAEIVSYQPDNFRQFITINRGSRDGIKAGQAVISEGQILVGRISEVTLTQSKVFLLTDPDFRVGAIDQDSPARASGTVKGQIGAGLLMERIPQDQPVKPGDTIITSGLAGELPKGLIIGRVESINQKDNAVFQSAQIVSSIKFNRLELVFVMVGGI